MSKINGGNPFKRIPIIRVNMLFESALTRAKKVSPPKIKGGKIKVEKIWLLNKIETLKNYLTNKLGSYLKVFPKIDSLHPFYKAIISIYGDIDTTKKYLGRIYGSLKVIDRLTNKYKLYVRTTKKNPYITEQQVLKHLQDLWKQYIARIHSVLKKLEDSIDYLNSLILKLKKLPDYNPEYPTVVVAGPPNSGKSSLVKVLSNAKVEIASYPFTTKNLVFGHIVLDEKKDRILQIVDSPGLFDRPLSSRKKEELLALEAVRTIADGLIFLFDGSQERVLDANSQLKVFNDVINFLKTPKILVAINKIDIANHALVNEIQEKIRRRGYTPLSISIKNGIGIEKIILFLKHNFL